MESTLACAPPLLSSFRPHHSHDYDYPEIYEAFHMEETFQIEDILDFDNDDIGAPIGNCDEDNENTTSVDSTEASGSVSASASASASLDGNTSPENPLSQETLVSELYVPTDALADLEWLSPYMMVDDFSSGLQAVVPSFDVKTPPKNDDETKASQLQKNLQRHEEKKSKDSTVSCSLPQWMSVRARSKHFRTGGRVWTNCPLLLPKCSLFESHGSLFNFTSSDYSSATSRPPLKKTKLNNGYSKKSQDLAAPRRCSHCQVQKTPQWRAGPLGPKTLCNACGVRYKSGRLLPEYRPAISPTFLGDVHSNSHRKVLELRRQKEDPEKFDQPMPQIFKNLEDEENRREHSTVTEDTYIAY